MRYKLYATLGLTYFLVLIEAAQCRAGAGDLVATFNNMQVSDFAMQPSSPYMYATVANSNSLAVFNTQTLALESTFFVGSSPRGMAFSPDGSRLYVANATSNLLSVVDTATRSVVNSFVLPDTPRDVEFGNQNRLFVLCSDSLLQIDATTGANAGPQLLSSFAVYSGALEISPDRNTLFYADYGLSPASLYKLDVSTTNANLLWESPHGGLSGSNGQDLTISHNGSFISYPCGAGQGGYVIAKYDTSNMAILGSFATGAYPREIAFSPDDSTAYTVHTAGAIDRFSTQTFLPLEHFVISSGGLYPEARELEVSASGRYLFATVSDYRGDNNRVLVYDTGVPVPEPATQYLALTGAVVSALLLCRRGFARSWARLRK